MYNKFQVKWSTWYIWADQSSYSKIKQHKKASGQFGKVMYFVWQLNDVHQQ